MSHPHHRSPNASIRRKLSLINLLGDFLFGMIGLSMGYVIRFHTFLDNVGNMDFEAPYSRYFPVVLIGSIFLVLSLFRLGVYNWRNLLRVNSTMRLVSKAILIWFAIYLGISFAVKFNPQISRIYMGCALATTFLSIWAWKSLYCRMIKRSRWHEALSEDIVFLGWSDQAQSLADAVHKNEDHPYTVRGVIESSAPASSEIPSKLFPRLGSIDAFDALLAEHHPDIVVIADPQLQGDELSHVAELCEIHYADIKIIPSMFQLLLSSLHMESISGVPILGVEDMPLDNLMSNMAKRCVDIIGGLVGLMLSAPLIAAMAFSIKREDGGPIFYKQIRTGYLGRPFTIYKIRSMRVDAEAKGAAGWTVKDDPRRLKVGEFMRKWNIDEVPQFWNVLKGDMSLVGPRPERPEHIQSLEREIKRYNKRHHVKPGLTGWAQVNGLRGDTSLTERIRYDIFYIENANLIFDFQIMFMTFFKRDNAY